MLDVNRIAIAPFDVYGRDLALWREGLVDLLSRTLDGAGPIAAVPPSRIMARWRGRADRPSAAALGRATGAGLVCYGQVLAGSGDTVRVVASVLDVSSGSILFELAYRDGDGRLDQAADSLTASMLRELGRSRPIGAFRGTPPPSQVPAAMRQFLQGEQAFRRGQWDSAFAHYERAVELDSSFAVALRRAGEAAGWTATAGDPVAVARQLLAGARNRGLSPRDSVLVVADSLLASLASRSLAFDPAYVGEARRLLQLLQTRLAAAPDDPEVWYKLADAQHHFAFAPIVRITFAQIRESFDRAIALDSGFAPAYVHPVQLALQDGDEDAARAYLRAYLRLSPRDVNSEGLRSVERLLRMPRLSRASRDALLASLSVRGVSDALAAVQAWPGGGDAALALAELRATPGATAWQLAFQGRLSDGRLSRGDATGVSALVFLGVPVPSLAYESVPRSALFAQIPAWVHQHDSLSLRRLNVSLDSAIQQGTLPAPVSSLLRAVAEAIPGLAALIRGDSAAALGRLLAAPSDGDWAWPVRLTRELLLARTGRDEEAAALLGERLGSTSAVSSIVRRVELARVSERLGRTADALRNYRYVAAVWADADPPLQPIVAEARAAIARLSSR